MQKKKVPSDSKLEKSITKYFKPFKGKALLALLSGECF
jgi:hypothetical protein